MEGWHTYSKKSLISEITAVHKYLILLTLMDGFWPSGTDPQKSEERGITSQFQGYACHQKNQTKRIKSLWNTCSFPPLDIHNELLFTIPFSINLIYATSHNLNHFWTIFLSFRPSEEQKPLSQMVVKRIYGPSSMIQ